MSTVHLHDFKAVGATYTACGLLNPRGRKYAETNDAERVTCRNCQASARFEAAAVKAAA